MKGPELILVVLGFFLLAGSGAFFFSGEKDRSASPAEEVITFQLDANTASEDDMLLKLREAGAPYRCEMEGGYEEKGVVGRLEGVIFMNDGKERSEMQVTIEGMQLESGEPIGDFTVTMHYLYDKEYLYFWRSDSPQAVKVRISPEEMKAVPAQDLSSGPGRFSYRCVRQNVNESHFKPPVFQLFQEMPKSAFPELS